MPDNVPQLLPLLAVAQALAVSPHTVRAWVRKGKLRPVRLCRRLLFDPHDLVQFLAAAKEAPTGESANSPRSAT
jgi:excisionase family DNA binding protein